MEILNSGLELLDSPKEQAEQKEFYGDSKTIKNKKRMIAALQKNLGLVSAASKATKIPRSTHYYWVTDDPKYRTEVEDIDELSLDFVEAMQYKRIKEGSDILIKWYLGTKGASRGYREVSKVEVTGKNGGAVEILQITGIEVL